ncbi:MAG: hypothetical protein ACD_2C00141G0015 [uncultured bacterium (gcode 4)]|uniref:Uncharacterized protein n=1 Tax=uncultured bacterium (gcode 4) TaxID=1234023 RepID=K2G308_9BACT|nr:MAG: hypothetical protein ACD_2C00141G0015 [uncultured bacterium (gcode 4)]
MRNRDRKMLWAFRIFMWGLIIYEFLNWINILDWKLNFSWHGLIITDIAVWLICEAVISYKKGINLIAVLPVVLLSVYLDVFWDMFHLYSKIHNYDKFLHFFISSIVAYVIYEVLKDKLYKDHFWKILSSVIIISITSTFWMLYEIEEYLEDAYINKKLLRMWNSFDTWWDLLTDLLGWVLVVIVLLIIHRKKKKL